MPCLNQLPFQYRINNRPFQPLRCLPLTNYNCQTKLLCPSIWFARRMSGAAFATGIRCHYSNFVPKAFYTQNGRLGGGWGGGRGVGEKTRHHFENHRSEGSWDEAVYYYVFDDATQYPHFTLLCLTFLILLYFILDYFSFTLF